MFRMEMVGMADGMALHAKDDRFPNRVVAQVVHLGKSVEVFDRVSVACHACAKAWIEGQPIA